MLIKKCVVDQIEHRRSGEILVRFGKIIEDDGKEISCEWHRVCIPQETDEVAQMQAVQNHLESMGWPRLSDADIQWVTGSCTFNKAVHPV